MGFFDSKSTSDSSVTNTTEITSITDSYNSSKSQVANISGSYNRTDSGGNVYVGDVASKAVEQLSSTASQAGAMDNFKIPLFAAAGVAALFVVFAVIKKR